MNRPALVVMIAGGSTHAAHAGERVTLCGVVGASLPSAVRGAFDVHCRTCAVKVIAALNLTALTDPTNVEMRPLEDDEGGDQPCE